MKSIYLNPIIEAGLHDDISVKEKLRYSGLNTGNMVFVEAIKQQIDYKQEDWINSESLKEQNADNIGVISCANVINVNSYFFENIYKYMKNIKFPITLVGVGAQSTIELNTPRKLISAIPKEKLYILKSICDQTVSIGIRGEFTAECLELLGIKNFKIIGCPSIYLYNKEFIKLKSPSVEKCVFNTATYIPYEYKLINLGMQKNLIWIMQTMAEMPRTVYENCEITEELMQKKFPGFSGKISTLENYMRKNAKIFFKMSEWYSYMINEKFTFSFGGRFHGNVVALRSGIPALWITHDSRTKELTELFNLPSVEFSRLDNIINIEELLEFCSYDKFYKIYPKRFHEYIKFLDENGIDHKWK